MAFYRVKNKGIQPEPGHSHTLSFCRDKMVLFGGTNGEVAYNDLLFFDLTTNKWVKPDVVNQENTPSPRFSHIAHFVPTKNGLVVASGTDSQKIFKDMYIFLMSTNSWRKIGDRGHQPTPRYGALSFYLNDGSIIVLGGNGGSDKVSESRPISDLTVYDFAKDEWIPLKTENLHKEIEGNNLLGVMTPDESHLIITGNNLFSIHLLDLEDMVWTQHSAEGFAPNTRIRTPLTLVSIDQAIFFGGVEDSEVRADAYILDFTNFEFEWSLQYTRGVIPQSRMGHSLTNLGNSLILLGGTSRKPIDSKKLECFNDMYIFDPLKGLEWQCLPQLGTPPMYRIQHVMLDIPDKKKIFIHGGDCMGIALSDIFLYDYQKNEWEDVLPNQIIPLVGHSAAYNEEEKQIFMYAGGDLTESFMYTYRISSVDWTITKLDTKKTPPPRVGHHCFFYKGYLYSYGGFVGKSGIVNDLIALDTGTLTWEACPHKNEEGSEEIPKATLAYGICLRKNILYVLCGIAEDDVNDKISYIDLEDMKWRGVKLLGREINLYGFKAEFIDDKTIFVFGGTNIYQNSIETYSSVAYTINLTSESKNDSVQLEIFEEMIDASKQPKKMNKIQPKGKQDSTEEVNQSAEWNRIYITGDIPGRIFHSLVKINNKVFVFGGNRDPNMYSLEFQNIEITDISSEEGLLNFYDAEIIEEPKDEADISILEEKEVRMKKQKKKDKKDLIFGPSKNELSAISASRSKPPESTSDDKDKYDKSNLNILGESRASGSMGGSGGSKGSGNVHEEENPDVEHLKRAGINNSEMPEPNKKKKGKKKKEK